jgi:hypothetical protein
LTSFSPLKFPNEDALTATLAAFGTYFVGFVGRPIGAATLTLTIRLFLCSSASIAP